MRNLIIKTISIIAAVLIINSCKGAKPLTEHYSNHDSIAVKYRERTVFVPDTIFVEIAAQQAERTTRDSVSHLENEYSISDAMIRKDGSLFHNLISKKKTKLIPIKRPIEYRDSVVYKEKIVTKDKIVTEYIERKLSWGEKTQIYGFWAALIILLITFRRTIFKNIVRIIFKK